MSQCHRFISIAAVALSTLSISRESIHRSAATVTWSEFSRQHAADGNTELIPTFYSTFLGGNRIALFSFLSTRPIAAIFYVMLEIQIVGYYDVRCCLPSPFSTCGCVIRSLPRAFGDWRYKCEYSLQLSIGCCCYCFGTHYWYYLQCYNDGSDVCFVLSTSMYEF